MSAREYDDCCPAITNYCSFPFIGLPLLNAMVAVGFLLAMAFVCFRGLQRVRLLLMPITISVTTIVSRASSICTFEIMTVSVTEAVPVSWLNGEPTRNWSASDGFRTPALVKLPRGENARRRRVSCSTLNESSDLEVAPFNKNRPNPQ